MACMTFLLMGSHSTMGIERTNQKEEISHISGKGALTPEERNLFSRFKIMVKKSYRAIKFQEERVSSINDEFDSYERQRKKIGEKPENITDRDLTELSLGLHDPLLTLRGCINLQNRVLQPFTNNDSYSSSYIGKQESDDLKKLFNDIKPIIKKISEIFDDDLDEENKFENQGILFVDQLANNMGKLTEWNKIKDFIDGDRGGVDFIDGDSRATNFDRINFYRTEMIKIDSERNWIQYEFKKSFEGFSRYLREVLHAMKAYEANHSNDPL